jgi:parvulin-like peptidyl-prolyl isomerase
VKKQVIASSVAWALCLAVSQSVHAQDTVVAHLTTPSGTVTVTQADVSNLVKPLQPDVRAQLAAAPQKLDALVRTRLAAEAAIAEAQAKGWDKQPQIQAQIEDARRQVILRTYLTSVSEPPAAYPSDAEIQVAYDHNQNAFMMPQAFHVAQIFVAVPPGADVAGVEQARQRAVKLADQAHRPGADFAALAQANSDDKGSAAHGGDQGFLADPMLMPEIRKAVDGMKPGDISGAIQTSAGFHVIRLIEVRAAGVAPLAAVKDQIRSQLRQQRQQQDTQAYLAKLVGSGVTIDENALKKAITSAQ